MDRVFLQDMADNIRFGELPVNWNSFDLKTFSKSKRKKNFFAWYADNGQHADVDIRLKNVSRNIRDLLTQYHEAENEKLPYEYLINRMCFWMATGSGKTLVLIKLVQILKELIQRLEIPAHDILILTHRDDLIGQLKLQVNEFNTSRNNLFIQLRELKEYDTAKRENPSLFKELTTLAISSPISSSGSKKERTISLLLLIRKASSLPITSTRLMVTVRYLRKSAMEKGFYTVRN